MSRASLSLGSLSVFALLAMGCSTPAPETPAEPPAATAVPKEAATPPVSNELVKTATSVFKPLPAVVEKEGNPITEAKVALGRTLFYEPRLSKNHDISCNSCHQLDNFGVDGEPTSPGHKGQRGDRNSPTVYNAALHFAQFWDGRAADVEEQAGGPVLNSVEMAMPGEDAVLATLASMPGYVELFKAAYPDDPEPISYDNLTMAIGAFERKLMTPGRFDAFLGGDASALTAEEQRGLKVFLDTGCASCHNGVALGGASYQKLGAIKAYETKDLGREALTGSEADRYVFKVPSLRNIAETGPYFHDGSVAKLEDAVRLMADHQLGRELKEDEVHAIEAFLKSLTGEPPVALIKQPELPASGPTTPAPDPS